MKNFLFAASGLFAALLLAASAGCGIGQPVGEYHAEVRVAAGLEESRERGYSLSEMKAKLDSAPQKLELRRGGRFIWHTGAGVNEGTWQIQGETIIIRDDISRGIRIHPSLQTDRIWRFEPGRVIVDDYTFSRYNIEIVYRRR